MWKLNKFEDKTAIVTEDGDKISYRELSEASIRLADMIGGRCLVFCLCRNETGSLLGYLSFVNNGIVPALLDSALNRDLLATLTESYKPDYLWVPNDVISDFSGMKVRGSMYGYSLLKTGYNREYPLYDGLALLLTTSGSTGSPKFVRQSYENIKANTEAIISYLEIGDNERPITTLPMSYTYGLSIINTHIYAGASIILTQKTVMQKDFWRQFRDFEATSFGGVPYIYEMLDKLRFTGMKLPSLRTMTQAGGKLSPELHKKFAEYAIKNGVRFFVMYGQTEATARMSYLPWQKSLEKYGSMGIAIPGGKFELIDINENTITEPDITGELVYEGANVTLGYAESGDDLIKGDELHGRLVTGDMAKKDADGFYYIVGRKKRFLKIFGSRVNLDETERMIKSSFPHIDCACAGIDDKLYVFVTAKSVIEDVYEYLKDKTDINRQAVIVKFIEKIPLNESGKTQYIELEKYYN
jgi:acyl-coenzyme A synthetase/AMP-(fatty) acid ligase